MEHLVILFFTVTLLVGGWAAFVTRQLLRSRPLPCLGPLLRTILFMNLMVFLYQAAEYVLVNLFAGDLTAIPAQGLVGFCLTAFCVEMGLAYSILQTARDLGRHESSPTPGRVFLLMTLTLAVSYAIGSTLLLSGGTATWLRITHLSMATTVILAVTGSLGALAIARQPRLQRAQRKAVKAFAWCYLAGFWALLACEALPEAWQLPAAALALLWTNGVPLVWYRAWFPRYAEDFASPAGISWSTLLEKKGVTRREREVMDLVLEGKSNKEIEDQLCISFSTVKNHLYSLYRKLGVSSRTQLMRLLLENGDLAAG